MSSQNSNIGQFQFSDPQVVRNICADFADDRGKVRPDLLIEILHAVQHRFACVEPSAQQLLAEILNISPAEVYGTLSFYDDFCETPRGSKFIRICRGESCQAQGANTLWDRATKHHGLVPHEKTAEGVELAQVFCLGNCVAGPSADVNHELVARLDADKLDKLIEGA